MRRYQARRESEDCLSCIYEFFTNQVADTLKTEDAAFEPVLQDGGEVNENILMVLGPEIWEDFQTNFLDVPS